jgi:3-oxoacyl-[acyl-carrier protein] reductase
MRTGESDVGRLEGKTALITGSSRGLGAAMARRFASEGANVAVNYRVAADKAAEVVADIEAGGGKAIAVQADCTQETDVARMVDEVVAAFGDIRVLVNNSGILNRSRIVEMSTETWDEMMASHLRAYFLVSKYCLNRSMLELEPVEGERVAAKIINIGSGLVNRGGLSAVEQVHYMTAKAGVAGFTRGLAAELAPKITVNLIAPGIHLTDMIGTPPDDVVETMAGYFLLGMPELRDVTAAATFLASSDADHVTAEVMTTNGGST